MSPADGTPAAPTQASPIEAPLSEAAPPQASLTQASLTQASLTQASLTHAEVRSIIIGILVAMFLAALDQTIVATALPTIGRDLGDLQHLPWVVTAYLLAATAVTPLYGKASDIYGRRITLLVSIGVFIVGSIACAVAPSMPVLILARAVQGLGGGGLISLAQTIVADVVSPRERARYQAYFGGVFAASSVLGPVLGGLFAQHLHWSAVFWINLPLGALAFVMTNTLLKRLPRHDRRHRLDFLGAGLMAAAAIAMMLALNWGGLRFAWGSSQILGLFAVSALLWCAFAWRLRTAAEPLIPPAVLADRVVAYGTLGACCGMGVFIGLSVYAPVYFQTVYGLSAGDAGLALIPLAVGTVIGATVSGRVMPRITHYKRLPLWGCAVGLVGSGLLAIWPDRLSLAGVATLLAVISMGLGTLLPVTTVAVQNAVAPHQMGTATASMNFFRSLGGAILVAGFGAIVLSGVPAGSVAGGSLENLGVQGFLPASLVNAFGWMFAATALGFAATLLWLTLMEERPLRGTVHQVPVTD